MYSLLYSNFAEIRFCFDIAIVTENMAQLGNYLIRDNLLRTWQKFIFNIRLIKIKKQLLFQASFFYNKKVVNKLLTTKYYAYWLKNKIYKKALKPKLQCIISGSATGNRTPDFALRGRRLSRLTMAPLAPGLGLEPRPNDPESLVLPLHHPGVLLIRTKFIITEYSLFDKSFL